MRTQFAKTIASITEQNPRVALLFGDVGGYSFRHLETMGRAINMGISEQAMISAAAGLARSGCIPIVYSIAPFLAERALEQIKLDIAYQGLKVIIVTVGASFDYATMGATHHCPADVPTLYNVPGLRILTPGAPGEVDAMLRQAVEDEHSYYIRLSAQRNVNDYGPLVKVGKAIIHQSGSIPAAIIAVGNTMAQVTQATLDVSEIPIIYLPTVRPLDTETITAQCAGKPVLLIEPFYATLYKDIAECGTGPIVNLSVPRQFIHHYGTLDDFTKSAGLHYSDIREAIWKIYPNTKP